MNRPRDQNLHLACSGTLARAHDPPFGAEYGDVDKSVRSPTEARWLEEAMEAFLAESAASLEYIGGALTELERRPGNGTLTGILRALHTIKGTASCLGLSTLAGVAHECEALAAESWDGRGAANPAVILRLRDCCGTARTIVDELSAAAGVGVGSPVKNRTGDRSMRSILTGLVPLAHGLAERQGKHVVVEIDASEWEIDERLLHALKASMVHVVHNAVTHGIETPAVRTAVGKTSHGTLRLRTFERVRAVVIEIDDDGKGLDVRAIRGEAIECGMLTAEQAGRLSDSDIHQLIFCRGLSMAEAVTVDSGRGIGMDVVKAEIESVGGRVSVESLAGRRTVVRMMIPIAGA